MILFTRLTTTIPKSGKPLIISANDGPIMLLYCLSELADTFTSHMKTHFENNNLLPDEKLDFRNSRITTRAIR